METQPHDRITISDIFNTVNEWQAILVFEPFLGKHSAQYINFNYPKADLIHRNDGLLYAFRIKSLKKPITTS